LQKDTNKSFNILVYYCFTVTKECLQREQTPFHTGLLLSRILKSKSSPYPKLVDLKDVLLHCRVEFNSVSRIYVINVHIQKAIYPEWCRKQLLYAKVLHLRPK